jgi:hypothetical protein
MCQVHPKAIDPATNTAVYDFDHRCPNRQPYSYRRVMTDLMRSGLCAGSGRVGGNFWVDRRYVLGEREKQELEKKIPGGYGRDQVRGIQLVLAEHRRRGWPEPLFYPADEPRLEGLPGLAKTGDLYRKLGAKTVVPLVARADGPSINARRKLEGPYLDAIGQHIDVWCVIASQLTPRVVRRARQSNKELWAYNGGSLGHIPIAARRFFGRYVLRWGLDGVCQWAIYPGRSAGRDTWYVLQGRRGIVPAAAWEAVREGVDDLRYDATARHWIAAARKAGLRKQADAADKTRKAFFETMPEDHYWSWSDDFSRADYDRHRHRTADRIATLIKVLE